ncbi:glycoside hydrolase family 32 protein [Staphylococcus lugdunensis]|uniref:glycoside hydrolase family 32 protein n=1 Tax=Staphylococcus lugdunensis TaxID=28035 RepID=UPI002095BA18|nr:sucrose-6-phosphate hydrolase [Staphylococcus lugdunensis]MCO7040669.1 sucrose-6-phosphate hydrolase [Staphylococcus lugdunensis]
METQNTNAISNDRYRLGYHIMPKSGWINDPNGFSYFNGYYHIFYQHYPYAPEWGPMHWGHARSKDLVHWETLPIALTPGDTEDKDGCFSGTGIVKDDTLYLFYTGHHYYGDNDPDHFWQNQNMAFSQDGLHFTKYQHNAIIPKPPEDNTHHFRDPKVWQHGDDYYMIVGSQNNESLGRIILYRSHDLLSWDYIGPVDMSNGQQIEGYMWECPDLFELDGQHVLLFSPQGMDAEEEQYLNLFQNGYFVGDFDYDNHRFTRDNFKELDHGHDFYAPQTMQTPDGRRILIGWMAMWESHMPEKEDGWSGALTLPRELHLNHGNLYMTPIEELKQLRKDEGVHDTMTVSERTLLSEGMKQVELNLLLPQQNFKLQLTSQQSELLSVDYDATKCKFTLYRNDLNDCRYTTIKPSAQLKLQMYIDTSSVELFINDGEAVFTERFYSETAPKIWVSADSPIKLNTHIYELAENAIQFD